MRSFANEIGNLAQVVGRRVKGINTIYFIKHEDIMEDQKATYSCIVVDYFPQKEDPYRTWLTVGRNLLNPPGEIGTNMVDMLKYKLLLNFLLFMSYAKFTGIHIKNFYFNTPMDQYEHMRLPIKILPQDIINEYHFMNKVKMNSTCVEFDKETTDFNKKELL